MEEPARTSLQLDAEFSVKTRTAAFDLRLDGSKRRLEIRNSHTRDAVYVYGSQRDVRTTEDTLRIEKTGEATFAIVDWGMTIDFPDTGGLPIVRCKTDEGSIALGL